MFENPRRSRQARNFTTNVPKILDLKSSSEQIFFRKLSLGAPEVILLLPDSRSNRNMKMLVFEERGKPEYPEKTFQSKGENQQQNQPTYGVHARPLWWDASAIPCFSLSFWKLARLFLPFPSVQIVKCGAKSLIGKNWIMMKRGRGS